MFKRISAIVLLIVAFSIVFPIRVNSLVSIFALVFYLFLALSTKTFDIYFFKTPVFMIIFLQSIILMLGLTHTSDLHQGFADIERFGYALLFPFLIYQLRQTGTTATGVVVAFSLGCLALIIYGLGCTIVNLNGENFWDLGHTYFINSMQIHPTYISIYVIFIIFYLLELLRTRRSSLSPVQILPIALILFFLVAILFFVRSQMSLLAFVMLSVLYFVVVLKRRAWLVTFILFTIGFLVFLLDRDRVSTFFDTYGKNVSSALDNRFKVWNGAVEAIKESPIIGGGTGSEHEVLNKAYLKVGYVEGKENSYNAHNQYLEFLVRNGPVELIAFIFLMVYAFRQALQYPNYLFLVFCMLFSLHMLSESCMQLHKGIVFFFFFLSAFIFLPFEPKR